MANEKKKIEKLTPKQEQQLIEFRDKWLEVGTSCEPADWKRAEAAITKMYEKVGYDPPEFVHVRSPLEAVLFLSDVKVEDFKKMTHEARAPIMQAARDHVQNAWWGQTDGYWIAFYLFARDYLGVEYEQEHSDSLDLWAEIAQSICWWWPGEKVCIISDRPEEIHWEPDVEQPRLHNADGPALSFRDGWALYRWFGMPVPKDIIEEPEKITIDRIVNEGNVEIRRVMVERYGQERYLKDRGMELVHKDQYGELYKCPEDEDILMVKVVNSTPEPDGTYREYFIPVDPNVGIQTAKAAVAWTFNMSEDEYEPVVQT